MIDLTVNYKDNYKNKDQLIFFCWTEIYFFNPKNKTTTILIINNNMNQFIKNRNVKKAFWNYQIMFTNNMDI